MNVTKNIMKTSSKLRTSMGFSCGSNVRVDYVLFCVVLANKCWGMATGFKQGQNVFLDADRDQDDYRADKIFGQISIFSFGISDKFLALVFLTPRPPIFETGATCVDETCTLFYAH